MTVSRKQGQYRDGARGGRRRRRLLLPVVVAAVALIAAACGSSGSGSSSSGTTAAGSSASAGTASAASPTTTAPPHHGGSITVLEAIELTGGWGEGLDPATSDTLELNNSMLDAIYGSLFEIGNNNNIIPDLATGYSITDGGRMLTIDLRHGVKFSDGTPFNAAAVLYNYKRDLKADQDGVPPWPKSTMTAPNPYTVRIKFSQPDGAAVSEMMDSAFSWIASPTAIKKEGKKRFEDDPVGAGPFEVVSASPSVKLVLKKNPLYWEKGHPYLDGLTFESVSSDETALEDMEAKDANVYEFMTTPQLVNSFAKAGFTVTTDPSVAVLGVQLNTFYGPFTNLKAREAVYYALDVSDFTRVLKNSCVQDEGGQGPGARFYEPKVPGYRTYDLPKAKALVQQIGGLSFTMYYTPLGLSQEEAIALRQMFDAAGMKVKLVADVQLSEQIAQYNSGKWEAFLTEGGSYDPAGSDGVALDLSTSTISGVHDPEINKLIHEGAAYVSMKARAKVYDEFNLVNSQKAYGPNICAPDSWDVMDKGISGPGLTTIWGNFGWGPMVQWENVSDSNG